jgi:hypothetical protein
LLHEQRVNVLGDCHTPRENLYLLWFLCIYGCIQVEEDWKKEVTSLLSALFIEIFATNESEKWTAIWLEIAENTAMDRVEKKSAYLSGSVDEE